MPTAIDLVLDERAPDPTPDQLHGLACALFEGPGADHETSRGKTFTAWPTRATPEGKSLRFTLLDEDDHRGRPMPPTMRFGSRKFCVLGRRDRHVPYARLAAAPARSRVELSFETPTYFSRSDGRDVPLPDPILVFGSLARRWNQHAPEALQIPDEDVRRLRDSVFVDHAEITTLTTDAAHRNRRTGFIGTVAFQLTKPGRAAAPTLGVLAGAAEFLGVGAQTTRGFGVTVNLR